MATLDLRPQELDLKLYIGDDPRLGFTFYEDSTKTSTVDLSDYTSWAATIVTPAGSSASFTVDTTDAALGRIILELEGNDIRGFPHKGNRWDFRCVDPDGKEITIARGRVPLIEDVTV
jgi:hypothetical protein